MFVDLSGKVAIVTGSGQGIGEGIAKIFSKNGKVIAEAGPRQQITKRIVKAEAIVPGA